MTKNTTSIIPEAVNPEIKIETKSPAEDLQAQINELKRIIRDKERRVEPQPVSNHTSKLMFYKDCPIIEFGEVKMVDNHLEFDITWQNPDGTTETNTVLYLDAMNHNIRYLCEILDIEKQLVRKHQGPIPTEYRTMVADQEKMRTSTGEAFTPRRMVLEHTQVLAKAKVKFLEGPWDGKELTVDVACLNP